MSNPLFKTDIKFIQRMLSCAGFYKGIIDGQFGKLTQKAEDEFEANFILNVNRYGKFDNRTEGVISTLLPKAQVAARQFMQLASKAPFQVKLLSGTRTYAEQNAVAGNNATGNGCGGGGSGGHGSNNLAGGNGSDGIAIIRYLT